MKASEWIQMIWDTIPEASRIHLQHGLLKVDRVDESNIFELPEVCLHVQRDVPWKSERPVESERIAVELWPDNRRAFRYGSTVWLLSEAPNHNRFLGYELSNGTLSPRLEAGMDVVAVLFKKED